MLCKSDGYVKIHCTVFSNFESVYFHNSEIKQRGVIKINEDVNELEKIKS